MVASRATLKPPTRDRGPDAEEGQMAEYQLGEKCPPYVVVLRGVAPGMSRQAVQALSEAHGKRLDGSPILILPHGAEFEMWEVETPSGSDGAPK